MNPTLRLILQAFCFVAFAVTTFFAFAYHAMPWDALLGCFTLMGRSRGQAVPLRR